MSGPPFARTRYRCLRTALLLAAIGFVALPDVAYAYVDPTAGGMLLQIIVAGAAGLTVIVRLFWQKLTSGLFRRRTRPREEKHE